MTWLFEQPLIVVVLGVALIFALGAAWSASGRKELLYAAAAVLVLLIAGLAIERLVITDREAIRATLHTMARDLKNNDRRAVLAHIHPESPELRQKAAAELPNYQFTDCRVTKVHLIDVDSHAEPRSALVEFNVIASGTFREGNVEITSTVPRWVKLHLLLDKDKSWKVVDYEHDEPQRMIMNTDGQKSR
jgi:hypothetical protein